MFRLSSRRRAKMSFAITDKDARDVSASSLALMDLHTNRVYNLFWYYMIMSFSDLFPALLRVWLTHLLSPIEWTTWSSSPQYDHSRKQPTQKSIQVTKMRCNVHKNCDLDPYTHTNLTKGPRTMYYICINEILQPRTDLCSCTNPCNKNTIYSAKWH